MKLTKGKLVIMAELLLILATITFADYLRGNMDSLKQKTPVPFEREPEHLKKYLYIEKLRFGVGFDTEAVKDDGRSHIGMDNVRRRLRCSPSSFRTSRSTRRQKTAVTSPFRTSTCAG